MSRQFAIALLLILLPAGSLRAATSSHYGAIGLSGCGPAPISCNLEINQALLNRLLYLGGGMTISVTNHNIANIASLLMSGDDDHQPEASDAYDAQQHEWFGVYGVASLRFGPLALRAFTGVGNLNYVKPPYYDPYSNSFSSEPWRPNRK